MGSRQDVSGVIFHSDRGSQYGSRKFRDLLKKIKARRSMLARANPYDNAWTESCIRTLKNELLQDGVFIDKSEARVELFAYIDGYSNTQRRTSFLGCLSPSQFESNFYQNEFNSGPKISYISTPL